MKEQSGTPCLFMTEEADKKAKYKNNVMMHNDLSDKWIDDSARSLYHGKVKK
jgi:hypothetical protein